MIAESASAARRYNSVPLALLSLGPENSSYGGGEPPPLGRLSDELFAAGRGQRVEASFAIVFGGAPLGCDPAASLQALERGIERAVFDQQLLVGRLLDRPRDALAVLRAENERAQDQQVERALQEFQPFCFFSGRHMTRVCAPSGKMSTQKSLDCSGELRLAAVHYLEAARRSSPL